jgi:hypothetical protein
LAASAEREKPLHCSTRAGLLRKPNVLRAMPITRGCGVRARAEPLRLCNSAPRNPIVRNNNLPVAFLWRRKLSRAFTMSQARTNAATTACADEALASRRQSRWSSAKTYDAYELLAERANKTRRVAIFKLFSPASRGRRAPATPRTSGCASGVPRRIT